MREWVPVSFGVALVCLILMSDIAIGERLFSLALLSGLSLVFGLLNQEQNRARGWLAGGGFLLWVLLHLVWLIWLPQAGLISLLPWYALQNALLAWMVFWLKSQLSRFDVQAEKTEIRDNAVNVVNVVWLLSWTASILATLAISAWLAHIISFFIALDAQLSIIYLFGNWDHVAAFLAGLLLIRLIRLWWRNSEIVNEGFLIYGTAVVIALLGIYSRLLWFGLAPLDVGDTALLMCAGYVLFAFHHVAPSQPLFRLALLMPFLAILTVPWQLNSIYASGTLVAGATLYLLMQPRSQNHLPMYLGLLGLNVGLYLWIPGWVDNYKLLQLYTIPVAITVLLMLQLHQLELKPRVSNAIRLVALSGLYASATLDVFMRPELGIFMLAIGLSLGGVVLGIALRVRAFLYIGSLFLVFNVFGQLIDFYPEDRLGKAIVLMVLGGVITAGMIWFNIQREALMQRIRIIRADLGLWE